MFYEDDDRHIYDIDGEAYSRSDAYSGHRKSRHLHNTSSLSSRYECDIPPTDRHTRHHQQQHVHQQQLLLKEEEELKAEERRRKIISDVVRDGTENGLAGVSAGELLNKTHEELVLLLIQLRRQHSALQEARKHARSERDSQVWMTFYHFRFFLIVFVKLKRSSKAY